MLFFAKVKLRIWQKCTIWYPTNLGWKGVEFGKSRCTHHCPILILWFYGIGGTAKGSKLWNLYKNAISILYKVSRFSLKFYNFANAAATGKHQRLMLESTLNRYPHFSATNSPLWIVYFKRSFYTTKNNLVCWTSNVRYRLIKIIRSSYKKKQFLDIFILWASL